MDVIYYRGLPAFMLFLSSTWGVPMWLHMVMCSQPKLLMSPLAAPRLVVNYCSIARSSWNSVTVWSIKHNVYFIRRVSFF